MKSQGNQVATTEMVKKQKPVFSARQVHYVSGMIIAIFVGLHLLNHLMAISSMDLHIRVMKWMRSVYRNPVIETGLLAAVLVQIVSGLKLWSRRRKYAFAFFEKMHLWTGLYLSFFFFVHVSAVMMGRFIQHLDTNIYFGIAGLNTFPFMLFFYPYYFLSVVCFVGHIACVHNMKMKHNVVGITPKQQSILLLWLGVVLAGLLFYGFTDGFRGVQLPFLYQLKH